MTQSPELASFKQDQENPWSLSARWIVPVTRPPLENGIVTIQGERIVKIATKVGDRKHLNLGNSVVMPGLVNAHTHLDLSGMRGLVPPTRDFTAWLRGVIQYRRGQSPEQVGAAICAGIAESHHYGTTLLGDIAAFGVSWPLLREARLRSIVFHELLGLPAERAAAALTCARTWLKDTAATPTCRPGLSPHAPYSVATSLFRGVRQLAEERKIPVTTHLAETREELELLERREGPFVSFLRELGVWAPDELASSPQEVIEAVGPALFVHGNHLDSAARLPADSTIVYCPRTHHAFGHEPHPFRDFLARGIRVALGTDSLASNPDLDVLAEARFLHRHHPDVPGEQLVRMATLSGAEALGFADETGSLEVGKSADLIVIPLEDDASADPYRLVLGSNAPVQAVLFRGEWIVPGERGT